MSSYGHMSEMNRKVKENREKGGSSTERKKSTRLIKGSRDKFNVARRPKRNKIVAYIVTLSVFAGLLLTGFKALQSYNTYELNRPEIDVPELERENFELFMSYGQYDLESGDYEGAKIEFEHALEIYPDSDRALQSLKTANERLNNYQQFDDL